MVFPLVSRSTFTEDKETTRRYVEVTSRYSLMFAMAIAVVIAANPVDMLGLIYAPDYAELGGAGAAAASRSATSRSRVFAIDGTILNGAGQTRTAIIVAAFTLALSRRSATTSRSRSRRRPGARSRSPPRSPAARWWSARSPRASRCGGGSARSSRRPACVRIALATAAALVVGRFLPLHGKLMTLVEAGVVGLVFLVVLIGTPRAR